MPTVYLSFSFFSPQPVNDKQTAADRAKAVIADNIFFILISINLLLRILYRFKAIKSSANFHFLMSVRFNAELILFRSEISP